jgi:hypothetical protein
MYINVDNLNELCECHPELEVVRKITANHGEESEISLLCELIAKLYQKVDALMPKTSANAPEEPPTKITSAKSR